MSGGGSKESFAARSLAGFARALGMCGYDVMVPDNRYSPSDEKAVSEISSAAFVVHGGTIMSIMEAYAVPRRAYYGFQIGNGEGYELILGDDFAAFYGISFGSYIGESGMALSSGTDDRSSDRVDRKNYKKLSA